METVTVLQVLQTIHPDQQASYQKAIAIDQSLGWIPEERIGLYTVILKNLDEMLDHGDANIEIQIRDGELVSQEYGKRYKKLAEKQKVC